MIPRPARRTLALLLLITAGVFVGTETWARAEEDARFLALTRAGQVFVTTGQSMEPVWTAGDYLVVEAAAAYAVGEDIVFERPDGEIVSHRIVAKRGVRYQTQGVNNARPDRWLVVPTAIIGRVVAVIRQDREGGTHAN